MQTRETNIKQKIGGMTIHSLGIPGGLAACIDALGSSADAAWRWNQEGAELKLKQVLRTPVAPRLEEGVPGPRARGASPKVDPGDAGVQSLGAAPAKEALGGPARREAAWGLAQSVAEAGPGPAACGVEPCAHAPHTREAPCLLAPGTRAAGVGGRGWRAAAGLGLGLRAGGGVESWSPFLRSWVSIARRSGVSQGPIPVHSHLLQVVEARGRLNLMSTRSPPSDLSNPS